MPIDRDANIRAYVLKKQQARERAKKLREERLNRSESTSDEHATSASSKTTRIVGDPFAPKSTHVQLSYNQPTPTNTSSQENTNDMNNKGSFHVDATEEDSPVSKIDESKFVSRLEFEEWKEITQDLQSKLGALQEQVRLLAAENNTLRKLVVQRDTPKNLNSTKSARESADLSHDWEPTPLATKVASPAMRKRPSNGRTTPTKAKRSNRQDTSSKSPSTSPRRGGSSSPPHRPPDRNRMSKQLNSLKSQKRSSRKNLHSPKDSSRSGSSGAAAAAIRYGTGRRGSQSDSPSSETRPLATLSRSSHPLPPDSREENSTEISESRPDESETTFPEDDRPLNVGNLDEQVVGEASRPSQAIVGGAGSYNLDDLPQEAAEDQGPRSTCPDCGRKFAASALARHRRICKKVFGEKRKPMNMKKKMYDRETMQAKRKDAGNARRNGGRSEQPAGKKAAKWKNQSSSLRQAIRAARMGADAPFVPTPEDLDTRIPCPHCGRKFAEATAERHIPKCRNIKAKPKTLRRKR